MPIDSEVIERISIEEPSQLELEWKEKITPGDFTVYSTKIELICEEAKLLLSKTSISPIVQAEDCAVGLYTAAGDLAMACAGTYLHVGTGVIPIKYILKHYRDDPTVGIKDGDNFFVNDPLCGGIHAPDMINIVPIFWQGELIAWAAAAGHEPETGAVEPGGYFPAARSRWEEGFKCLPLKVGEGFKLKTDVMATILNWVRDERMILGDMRSRTAACLRIRERVLEMVRVVGEGFFVGLLRKVIESVAEGVKTRLRELNDGVYRHIAFFDMMGKEEGLCCVHVAVEKRGDRVTIDLSGTSPPTPSYLNARPHMIRAMLLGDLAMTLFAELPVSSALLVPFQIKAPENSCVNAPEDSAITGCTRLGPYVVNAIHICLAKAMFGSQFRERVTTELGLSGRTIAGGAKDQHGRVSSWLLVDTANTGGGGARSYRDGENAAVFWFSGFCDCLDIEHMEQQYPFIYLFRKLAKDQCGFGKYRGGASVELCYILHNVQSPAKMIFAPTASRFPQEHGLFGGYYGGLTPGIEFRDTKWDEVFLNPARPIPYGVHELLAEGAVPGNVWARHFFDPRSFSEGEGAATVGLSTGGYGDVLEREPKSVIQDFRLGLISDGVARNVYKVAYDGKTMAIDYPKTAELRDTERAERRERGKPYREFEKDWLKKKPREEILRFYGPWPYGIT